MADQPSHSAVSDSPPLLIFAYGTLMTGYGNNRLLDGAQSLGRAHTCESSFRMYHAGVPFVGRVEEGGVSVAGEVFAVSDAAMLNKLDNLEGHPDWYKRTPVDVTLDATREVLRAEIYLNSFNDGTALVPSGDFRDVASPAPRVLIASDKFKGSMSAAATVVRNTLLPNAFIQQLAAVDAAAGEGTVAALVAALNGQIVPVTTTDAQGRTILSSYGWLSPSTAVIEMSSASGLALVSDRPLCPRSASTFGTGTLLLNALERKPRHVIMAIGGSATNDGGLGFM